MRWGDVSPHTRSLFPLLQKRCSLAGIQLFFSHPPCVGGQPRFFEGHWTSEKSPTCNIIFFLVFLSIFGSFFSVFFLFPFFVSSFPFHSLSRILSVSLRFKERAPQKPDLFAAEALREPIPATMLLPKKCVVVVVDVVVVG